MSLRIRKSAEDRQAEIVEQTLRLAAEVGPDRTTTGAIAEAIGITQAAIFRHFPSKSELWSAVARSLGERMLSAWSKVTAAGKEPEEQLRAILTTQLRLIQSVPAIPAILFSRELHAENDALRRNLLQLMEHLQQILMAAIETGQRKGRIAEDLVPRDGAILLVSVIQGVTLRWFLSGRSFDLAETGQRLVDLVLCGFRRPPEGEAGR